MAERIKNRYDNDESEKEDWLLFQKCLIVLCLFSIGGQRREIVVNMTTSVSNYSILIKISIELFMGQIPQDLFDATTSRKSGKNCCSKHSTSIVVGKVVGLLGKNFSSRIFEIQKNYFSLD
jgi:hypothetical protein